MSKPERKFEITLDELASFALGVQGAGNADPATLDAILSTLGVIETQGQQIMADILTVKQLVIDLDGETNDLAAKVDAQNAAIAALQAQVAAGGTVSAADLQVVQDGLTSVSTRLKSIGASPTQPIPPPVA